jgi:hypothetical protein
MQLVEKRRKDGYWKTEAKISSSAALRLNPHIIITP